VTANPDGGWVAQQARNLLLVLGDQGRQVRFLPRDRDAKFTRSFDDVFRSQGPEVLRTPVQAPNASRDAHATLGPWHESSTAVPYMRRTRRGSLLVLRLHHWALTAIQGLFTVLMCGDCQAARGHGTGPYPTMTRAQLRASFDLLPTWVLEQKATANRHIIVVKRKQLAAGEQRPACTKNPG
jgi:hypothetical protein